MAALFYVVYYEPTAGACLSAGSPSQFRLNGDINDLLLTFSFLYI
jgi:hypothetical protein